MTERATIHGLTGERKSDVLMRIFQRCYTELYPENMAD